MRVAFAVDPSGAVVANPPPFQTVNGLGGTLIFNYRVTPDFPLIGCFLVFIAASIASIAALIKKSMAFVKLNGTFLAFFISDGSLWRALDFLVHFLALSCTALRLTKEAMAIHFKSAWDVSNPAMVDFLPPGADFRSLLPLVKVSLFLNILFKFRDQT